MKNKLLVITAISALALGAQAKFFDNNPVSDMMGTMKDAMHDTAEHISDTITDTTDAMMDSVDVPSLRGLHSLDDLSLFPPVGKWIKDGDFNRNFDDQPPLIPHKTSTKDITLNKNKCLSCHSNENWREEDSVKMTSSHFMTRSGKRLKTVSSRRYSCTQCHVPQINAEPLVGNDYINLDE